MLDAFKDFNTLWAFPFLPNKLVATPPYPHGQNDPKMLHDTPLSQDASHAANLRFLSQSI